MGWNALLGIRALSAMQLESWACIFQYSQAIHAAMTLLYKIGMNKHFSMPQQLTVNTNRFHDKFHRSPQPYMHWHNIKSMHEIQCWNPMLKSNAEIQCWNPMLLGLCMYWICMQSISRVFFLQHLQYINLTALNLCYVNASILTKCIGKFTWASL